MIPTCPAILASGKRKGEVCGNIAKFGPYCGIHKSLSDTDDIFVKVSEANMSYALQTIATIKEKYMKHRLNACYEKDDKLRNIVMPSIWVAILMSEASRKKKIKHELKIGYITFYNRISLLHFWVRVDDKIFDTEKQDTDANYSNFPLRRVFNDDSESERIMNVMLVAIAEKFNHGKEDIWAAIDKHCKVIMTQAVSDFVADVKLTLQT